MFGSGLSARLAGAVLTALLGMASAPAQAEDDVKASAPAAVSKPGGDSVVTKDKIGRAQITLTSAKDDLFARTEPTLRNLSTGTTVPAEWSEVSRGLTPNAQGRYPIAKGGSLTFQVAAILDKPATYVATIKVVQPVKDNAGVETGESELRQFQLQITRTAAEIPQNLVVPPPAASYTVAFPGISSGEEVKLIGALRNSGADSLALKAPETVSYVTAVGETRTSVAVAKPKEGASDGTATADCEEMLAQSTCALNVSFPSGLDAGRYEAEIAVPGLNGSEARGKFLLDVRLSPFWAGLLVGLGSLVGYIVQLWRESGRRDVGRRLKIAEARLDIEWFVKAAAIPEIGMKASELIETARQIDRQVGAGVDPQDELTSLAARYKALVKADDCLRRARLIEPRELLKALDHDLLANLAKADWEPATITEAVKRIDAELIALPDLIRAVNALKDAVARNSPLEPWTPKAFGEAAKSAIVESKAALEPIIVPPGATDKSVASERAELLAAASIKLEREVVSTALQRLKEEIDAALKNNVTPDLTTLRNEVDKLIVSDADLATALSVIDRASALNIKEPKLMQREGVASAGSIQPPKILDADTKAYYDFNPFLTGLGEDVSSKWLKAKLLFFQILSNAIICAVIAIAGVLALWAPDPSWGSQLDLLTALLAGMGTQFAIGNIAGLGGERRL